MPKWKILGHVFHTSSGMSVNEDSQATRPPQVQIAPAALCAVSYALCATLRMWCRIDRFGCGRRCGCGAPTRMRSSRRTDSAAGGTLTRRRRSRLCRTRQPPYHSFDGNRLEVSLHAQSLKVQNTSDRACNHVASTTYGTTRGGSSSQKTERQRVVV